eukprot:TRINITY_DN67147_c1_g2_i2.p1 TRINITY_DN67147_c1_g2~~TRINITY_DN67147_c1_g2_i2.p1  ORF type:complete len:208 (+),score=11.29 TRINITY_DN67147_c1_g2_i2:61-684(+)
MSAWPAGTWSEWPGSRIGGLVFCLIFIVILLIYFIRVARLRKAGKALPNVLLTTTPKAWKTVPTGIDVVQSSRETGILVTKYRAFSNTTQSLKPTEIQNLDGGHFTFSCCNVCGAILFSLVISLAVHFIPCLWWTCDWGEHDGQGVRGAIWFILWGVLAVVFLCCIPRESAAVVSFKDGSHAAYKLAGDSGTCEKIQGELQRVEVGP